MSETEREQLTSSPPVSYEQIRVKIDTLWKQIRFFHQTSYMLTLRNAANLVGFWRFPMGWSWKEYDRWMQKPLPYELKAAKLRNLHSTTNNSPNEWSSRAEAYRMTEVEKYLLRFINRV